MENRMVYDMVRSVNLNNLLTLVVLEILLKFLIVGRGEAIQCFVCNSKSDPRCADPIQMDWKGSDGSEPEDSNESTDGSLEPVECHLAVQYSAGIQAVSDILRGFGHARLGVPDLWLSASATLSSNTGSGYSGSGGGYNKGYGLGYGGKGYRGGTSWNTYGGQREPEESMGCHKVLYTDNNGDTVVDRGCAPARVANMDPCSALDSATSNNDNGNSGNTGMSNSNSGFGGRGGRKNAAFDMSQISADFCEVCTDADGCNGAANLIGGNSIFMCVLCILITNVRISL